MWSELGVFYLFVLSVWAQTTVPTVTISQGTVTGNTANDGQYYEFYGIPYADSTSGSHRFKAPSPPPSFQDTFVANRRDIKCVRALGVGYEGTEDCLVANVITPTLDSTRQLPVMVWIKGKEFDKVYEHELSFKNFVEKDVVIVTLNFRESILGFLCLGTETAPGNAGLKDIIAGLRWVKENIAQFGGNPESITLFGHGSGAAAVDLITLSPMADGLIQKAIAQSGTAIAPWAVTRDNLKYAIQVAEGLGHVVTNTEALSEAFTRTSIGALMAIINELELTDNSLAFAPCLERDDLEGVEPFLVKSPHQIIHDGELLQIPFMTGFVDNEGTIRAEEALEDDWLEKMDSSFTEFLQPDLRFANDEEEVQIGQQIKNFYFGNEEINADNIDKYISYHGDTMILVSAIREARFRATVSNEPIYLYQFSYKGYLGTPFVGPLAVDGAAHSEELAYLFYETSEPVQLDLTVADILIERWTNFAKTGNPTSETSQIQWQPFTTENNFYLRILHNDEIDEEQGSTLEVELLDPHPSTMVFWNSIYEDHFRDAETRWELDRNEVDDVTIEGSGEIDGEVDGDTTPEPPEEEEETEDVEEDDSPDSASTAVGYTFLIIALFTILNHFHTSQIIS